MHPLLLARAARWCLALAFTGLGLVPFQARGAAPGFHERLAQAGLRDQDNRPLRPAALQGKVVLVNFIFTACSTVCPVQARALVEVQAALPAAVRRNVQFVSVSLDPLSDTPAALKAYARRMGADTGNWSFVTGSPVGIDALADHLRLFKNDSSAKKPDDHATQLWLIDGAGRVLMRYGGAPPDVVRLTRELTAAQSLLSAAAPQEVAPRTR